MRILVLLLALALERSSLAADTTPPVLDAFTLSTTTIDTSNGPVSVQFCVTAHDESGFVQPPGFFSVTVDAIEPPFEIGDVLPVGLALPGCGTMVFPATALPGVNRLYVTLLDTVQNGVIYYETSLLAENSTQHGNHDLCDIGPCTITNVTGGSVPTTTTTLPPLPLCVRLGRDGKIVNGAYPRVRPAGCPSHEVLVVPGMH